MSRVMSSLLCTLHALAATTHLFIVRIICILGSGGVFTSWQHTLQCRLRLLAELSWELDLELQEQVSELEWVASKRKTLALHGTKHAGGSSCVGILENVHAC